MNDSRFVTECLRISARTYSLNYEDLIQGGRSDHRVAEARYCVYAFLREIKGWQSKRTQEALPYGVADATIRGGYLRYYELCEIYLRSMRAMRISWAAMNKIEN